MQTGYANGNYYEVHGTGAPLVVLHGGLASCATIGPLLRAFGQTRQVIGIDLQAHGRTADTDRPIRYEHVADDVAGVLDHLTLERADVIGYSFGGGAAWQLAFRHPQRVQKLVIVSTHVRRSAWYDEVLAAAEHLGPAAAEMMMQSPIYRSYAAIAPRPENFPQLLGKMGDLLRRDFDWTAEVGKLAIPVQLVFADADSVKPAAIMELWEMLGGGKGDAGWDGSRRPVSRLAILPGTTHYSIFDSPLLPPVVAGFLDA